MKRSYAEDDTTRHEVDRKQALQQLEEDFKSLRTLDCPVCEQDLDGYYSACARIQHLKTQMQVYIYTTLYVNVSSENGTLYTTPVYYILCKCGIYTYIHRYVSLWLYAGTLTFQ